MSKTAFSLKLTPIILSSDTPSFLEIIAASVRVKGTSPRSRLYTASLPINKLSINTFAILLFAGIFSFMASMSPSFNLFVIIIIVFFLFSTFRTNKSSEMFRISQLFSFRGSFFDLCGDKWYFMWNKKVHNICIIRANRLHLPVHKWNL